MYIVTYMYIVMYMYMYLQDCGPDCEECNDISYCMLRRVKRGYGFDVSGCGYGCGFITGQYNRYQLMFRYSEKDPLYTKYGLGLKVGRGCGMLGVVAFMYLLLL